MRRLILPGILLLATGAAAAQAPAPAPTPAPPKPKLALSDAEKERFLLEGEIVRRRAAPGGITNSERATLRWQGMEHDAHIQAIDEQKPQKQLAATLEIDFRDSYRNNVAAYRLDRILGLGMVPVTVVRHDRDRGAAFTWWVDDVLMDESARLKKKISAPDTEAWNREMYVVRLFDQLIYNFDRNLGNLLIDGDWRIWMIDHSRGFKIFKEVKTPKNLADRCARELLAGLRRLDQPSLERPMKDLLERPQIVALLARRDFIVKYYDAKIAQLGEPAVLYDLPARDKQTAAAR
jgi:hypothetical protein